MFISGKKNVEEAAAALGNLKQEEGGDVGI